VFTEDSLGFGRKPTFPDAFFDHLSMCEVADTLLEGKLKDELMEKIKLFPMSDSTALRRTEILPEDLI
jgi:hypothetical protein